MLYLLLCFGFVSLEAATTELPTMAPSGGHGHGHHGHTHSPHSIKEPSEHSTFKFGYDSHTHKMALTLHHECYIFTLSDSERTAVHSDNGMKTIELKLVGMLTTGQKTEVQKPDLDKTLAHLCGHSQHVYTVIQENRHITSESTTQLHPATKVDRTTLSIPSTAATTAPSTMPPQTTPISRPAHGHHVHTHAPHTTKELNQHSLIKFDYDSHTHKMAMTLHHECYIFTLSDNQRLDVRTDTGMKRLESKLFGMLTTGQKTEVQKPDLVKTLAHFCGHSQHIYTVV